jgi:NitT/TauT family transport system substrate-binding protein
MARQKRYAAPIKMPTASTMTPDATGHDLEHRLQERRIHMARADEGDRRTAAGRHVDTLLTRTLSAVYSPGRQKMTARWERTMRSGWVTGAAIALAIVLAIGGATTAAGAAEIRLAQQYSMGYLQFNVMKRDKLIEKYATQRGLKDFNVSWQRFNGPAAMNDALLSNSTDIVAGGVPGLITLWDKTQGSSLEIKGICALSSQPFLLNTANPDVKSIKDFSERDRIAVPSIKVSVQAVVLQMAVAAAFGEANYAKFDPLTVSMSPPDATIAMLSGAGSVSSVFSVPPFQFQQLEQKNIHTVLSSFDVLGPHTFTVAWTSMRFRKDNPELYAAFLDAVKEATAIIAADPTGTAQSWIDDSGSKLPLEMVTKVVTGPNVEWTMTPAATMKFAKFMYKVGSTKHEPASWKDMFFPEIGGLNGS